MKKTKTASIKSIEVTGKVRRANDGFLVPVRVTILVNGKEHTRWFELEF